MDAALVRGSAGRSWADGGGVVDLPGHFRIGGVGVHGPEGVIYIAPPARRVPDLMRNLPRWLEGSGPGNPRIHRIRIAEKAQPPPARYRPAGSRRLNRTCATKARRSPGAASSN